MRSENLLIGELTIEVTRKKNLKNLYILHDISFGGELRKAVLYIADRRQLFRLIEGDRYDVQARKKGVPLTEVLKDEPSVDRTLALIDAFLSTVPEEVTAIRWITPLSFWRRLRPRNSRLKKRPNSKASN